VSGRVFKIAVVVYLVTTAVYAGVAGSRLLRHSADNHFVYLADSLVHGQLEMREDPPSRNDWAHYRGRWYVSFPPFPAFLMVPGVLVWGMAFNDRLFSVLLAGLARALTFLLLARLRASGRSDRSERDDLVLTILFSFGTVYFFCAVQGTVWFTAHVVAASLLCVYALASLDARRPLLAGAALAAGFLTRTPLLFAFPLFVAEALRTHAPDALGWRGNLAALLRPRMIRVLLTFALPMIVAVGLAMAMNAARFGDPFEFGHRYLDIKWKARIETWGLFNYHYLARNLACALVLLPWLTRAAPFVKIGGHGLAIWFTTPPLAATLWPARRSDLQLPLWLTAAATAIPSLLYQNSGWLQFGYRFSLDYMPFFILLLAVGGRRLGRGFLLLVALSIAINLFGAITFDRASSFYDHDLSQRRLLQPD
jgi:hypothetical protein